MNLIYLSDTYERLLSINNWYVNVAYQIHTKWNVKSKNFFKKQTHFLYILHIFNAKTYRQKPQMDIQLGRKLSQSTIDPLQCRKHLW